MTNTKFHINSDDSAKLWQANNEIVTLRTLLTGIYANVLLYNLDMSFEDLVTIATSTKTIIEVLEILKKLMDEIDEHGAM